MKTREEQREAARMVGDLLREERRADDASLAEVFAASERDFEAMVVAENPDLFERMIAWLRALELPGDLLIAAPAAVRGQLSVRKSADSESGEASLAADADTKVEIAFENHHTETVWVVACERGEDGSVSFVPEEELAQAPQVEPGDALTFTFTPTHATVMRVVAIALGTQPQGRPAEVLAEPARLQRFGVVATARFTLMVAPPTK